SNAEVSLDLLSLNTYKTGYVSMREIVDHYFPPVGLLVKGGGEEFTDFNYWREKPLELADFSASESDDDSDAGSIRGGLRGKNRSRANTRRFSEDEGDMGDSYISEARRSVEDDDEDNAAMYHSVLESVEGGDRDEDDYDEEDYEDEDDDELDEDGPPPPRIASTSRASTA
ncbi:hypothetical protein KCU71_g18083, partial [Aureobasidium melanogenum]